MAVHHYGFFFPSIYNLRSFIIIIIIITFFIIIWCLITHFRINNELQCVYIQSQIQLIVIYTVIKFKVK